MNSDHQTIGKKKPEKNQGFNGIRTRDLREADAMLYQLSYEATQCFALVVQNVLQIKILKASKLRSFFDFRFNFDFNFFSRKYESELLTTFKVSIFLMQKIGHFRVVCIVT